MRYSLRLQGGGKVDVKTMRRVADLERLGRLRDKHPQLITRMAVAGTPMDRVSLVLSMPTAGSASYPDVIEDHVDVEIQVPGEYPRSPPLVRVSSTVWNPNVYASGLVCIGPIWIPTEGMDLFLVKMVRLLAFDPKIVNPDSPANLDAAKWYKKLKDQRPGFFPTMDLGPLLITKADRAPRAKMEWTNLK